MRASIDSADPGYCPSLFGSKVFFEGAEIKNVITADEEGRFVLVYRLDDKGDVMLSDDRLSLLEEKRYGHVRIEPPAGYQPTPADRLGIEPFNYTERS
jgi:hypothetical protein